MQKKNPENEFYERSLEPGDTAPDFTLPAHNAVPVNLKKISEDNNSAVVVFYRGHW